MEAYSKTMHKAFEYMKQLLHDLDIAVNHGGKGETLGVTNLLNGENVLEMQRTWNGGWD